MAKSLIDEIHISVYIPKTLPTSDADAIWKTLKAKRLQLALSCAIRAVFRRFGPLSRCTIKVSR